MANKVKHFIVDNVVIDVGSGDAFVYNDNTDSCAFGLSTGASGEHSIAIGKDTEALGDYSHSEGEFTTAEGDTSHAEGQYTTAFGTASHAEGEGGQVTLFRCAEAIEDSFIIPLSIGILGASDSDSAITFFAGSDIGSDIINSNSDSSGIPNIYDIEKGNKINGWIGRPLYTAGGDLIGIITDIDRYTNSITIDRTVNLSSDTPIYIKTSATGEDSHVEGYLSDASGLHSHAEGERTQATGTNAHAEGYRTRAFGGNSHAEGYGTAAYTFGSHSEGKLTQVEGEYSHTEGIDTKASGNFAHGEGKSSSAHGDWSHAEGEDSLSSGIGSHAEGVHTNAYGKYSHSEGYNTIADGNSYWEDENIEFEVTDDVTEQHIGINDSFSLDVNRIYKCECVQDRSYKFYLYNCENDDGTIIPRNGGKISRIDDAIIGYTYHLYKLQYTVAAHAEGKDTQASQTASHSEGINTRADGDAAHAEGIDSKSLSRGAHAEGINTFVNEHSEGSHTEGYDTQTDANYCHAEGWKTIVQNRDKYINRNAKVKLKSYDSDEHLLDIELVEGDINSLRDSFCERKISIVELKGEYHTFKICNFIVNDYDSTLVQIAPRYDWTDSYKQTETVSCIKAYYDIPDTMDEYPDLIYQVRRLEYTGYGAHAEGGETFVEGTFAHAEGEHTKALNRGAHAEGFKTEAHEKYSHAEGWFTKTTNKAEHAQGRYNKSNDIHINTTVEYVDLDLPSGNLWAKYNIGATSELARGNFYAWGEIETKENYSWDNYKYARPLELTDLPLLSDGNTIEWRLTKYCTDEQYWGGNTPNPDGLTRLVLEDDIAAKTLGENWRIPSKKDFEELINNTYNEWTEVDGRTGYKFMSKQDSSIYIFLPQDGDTTIAYWTSDIKEAYPSEANYLYCDENTQITISYTNFCNGLQIRPVSSKLKTINSVGVGESDGDHRNAIEITTDGNIFIKGIGNYDGSNPQSAQSLQYLLQELINKVNQLNDTVL